MCPDGAEITNEYPNRCTLEIEYEPDVSARAHSETGDANNEKAVRQRRKKEVRYGAVPGQLVHDGEAARGWDGDITFLKSEAHFRIVVEMGTGSVAWVASTGCAEEMSQQRSEVRRPDCVS